MPEPTLKLVNELSKLAESVYEMAKAHGEDKVILHMRGLRIEIEKNGIRNPDELNNVPVWGTEW